MAIRQVELGAEGVRRRYWWQRRKADHGMPTDQPIDPADEVDRIDVAEFAAAWGEAEH
ncbi:hypothetical protein [Amycolatopsis benzoatilytica]|uniref:hypothetical protein n=1 Tax=Amycolatopsis benzoatilytica TaxID=346045 RepID=UPI00037C2966|nr:hypothetical protein [Amycolatopsis benzoatilytica]